MTLKKPLQDAGHFVAASKPFRPMVVQSNRLPSASENPQAFLIVNDSHDGVPRGRLHISNGASWDAVALVTDIAAPVQQILPPPPSVDLTPLQQQIDKLARAVSQPAVPAIEGAAVDLTDVAQALAGITALISELQVRAQDHERRLRPIEAVMAQLEATALEPDK